MLPRPLPAPDDPEDPRPRRVEGAGGCAANDRAALSAGVPAEQVQVPHLVTDPSGTLVRNELSASPWFFTADLALSRDWGFRRGQVFRVSLGARNLFNEYPNELDQEPYRGSTSVYGPRFPRTLHASVGFQF